MQVKTPKVSVCVVTYNQDKYIRQCLQSIVAQETDFDFEVIVGDDCSTDGTRAIVQEFVDKYPDMVKPVFHEKNIGPTQNYFSVHNRVTSQYIAHLDGDDYCLPGKLQILTKQLDSDSNCAIVWHRMHIINEMGGFAIGMPITPIKKFINTDRLYLNDLAKYYGITGCHSGSMYRYTAKKIFARDKETIDYFMTLSFCTEGKYAKYIDEPLGVYRYFSTENTITKAKGNIIVAKAKLDLIKEYLITNPELAQPFAAQCLFELLLRLYLNYPLKMEYLKMLVSCKKVPALYDLLLILNIFFANRNKNLRKLFTITKR